MAKTLEGKTGAARKRKAAASMDTPDAKHCKIEDRKRFPFLRLPTEIRLMVYRYCCRGKYPPGTKLLAEDSTIIEGWVERSEVASCEEQQSLALKGTHVARLLRTCTTIYGEALPVLHAAYDWCLTPSCASELGKALHIIGLENRRLFKAVMLNIELEADLEGLGDGLLNDCNNLKEVQVTVVEDTEEDGSDDDGGGKRVRDAKRAARIEQYLKVNGVLKNGRRMILWDYGGNRLR